MIGVSPALVIPSARTTFPRRGNVQKVGIGSMYHQRRGYNYNHDCYMDHFIVVLYEKVFLNTLRRCGSKVCI